MARIRSVVLFLSTTLLCSAQMTTEQRLFDFEYLASQYAKFYAPYEWKRQLSGFDLYDIKPWLARVQEAKSDLEFYEIAMEYVASLNDTHSQYVLPSNFAAFIPIRVDIYDGKYLIDGVSRALLPASRYPFEIGDELVSIDGKTPAELTEWITKYGKFGNDRATRRYAAETFFAREQAILPRAHEIGESATVVVRRRSGDVETYNIPWTKTGVPVTNSGPVPSPRMARSKTVQEAPTARGVLKKLQTRVAPERLTRVLGLGSRIPIFSPPPGFQVRLGLNASNFHFSGVFPAEGKRIGYLRIPSFSPLDVNTALNELITEVAFFQATVDGLVVDITRNPGGDCYGEIAAQLLIGTRFKSIADEIRPNRQIMQQLEQVLASPPAGTAQWEIDQLQLLYDQLAQAYSENRGRTGPVPTCSTSIEVEPLRLPDGSIFAYTKPLVLLTDEFTISWGDSFAQVVSDAKRGPLFGMRTNGAGGSILGAEGGFFAEGFTTLTWTLGVRHQVLQQPGYPSTAYYENVGIWPDIEYDVMTEENLRSGFQPYVQAVTRAILDEINRRAR